MSADDVTLHALPSVLVKFRGENVRSFRDAFEISFEATAMAERSAFREVRWREGEGPKSHLRILPAAGIFGANASGKSNVLRALGDMRDVVLHSFRYWRPEGGTRRTPFRLGTVADAGPSLFEVDVVIDGVLHVYGFTLDDDRILQEWAHRYPSGRAQLMFERHGSDIKVGPSMGATLSAAVAGVRPNALLLSTAVAFKNSPLLALQQWFQRNLILAEAETRGLRQAFTAKQLDDESRRDRILALLRAADLGIVGVQSVEMDPAMRDKFERAARILTEGEDLDIDFDSWPGAVAMELVHRGVTGDVAFEGSEESLGTLVWLGLVGPIVDALDKGSVLLADELDASLHPALVAEVVRLFQDPDSNPHRAQLVFNSHDTNLLGDASAPRLLGRDQVWFTEKLEGGASRLYPLSDFNPRREEAIGKRYLAGRYGAVPILASGDFESALTREPAVEHS